MFGDDIVKGDRVRLINGFTVEGLLYENGLEGIVVGASGDSHGYLDVLFDGDIRINGMFKSRYSKINVPVELLDDSLFEVV